MSLASLSIAPSSDFPPPLRSFHPKPQTRSIALSFALPAVAATAIQTIPAATSLRLIFHLRATNFIPFPLCQAIHSRLRRAFTPASCRLLGFNELQVTNHVRFYNRNAFLLHPPDKCLTPFLYLYSRMVWVSSQSGSPSNCPAFLAGTLQPPCRVATGDSLCCIPWSRAQSGRK